MSVMQGQEDLTGEHMRHKSAPKDIEGGTVAGSAGSIFFGGVGVLKLLVQHSSSSGET